MFLFYLVFIFIDFFLSDKRLAVGISHRVKSTSFFGNECIGVFFLHHAELIVGDSH